MKVHLKVHLACVAAAAACSAIAQAAAFDDELIVGPISLPKTYQGETVTPIVHSDFKLATRADRLHLNARFESDRRQEQQEKSGQVFIRKTF